MSWLVIAKVSLIFALAWLAVTLMRRASASLRHLVAAVAIVAALLLPALELALPSWNVLPTLALPRALPTVASNETATPRQPPTEFTRAKVAIADLQAKPMAPVYVARQSIDWPRVSFTVWSIVTGALLTLLVLRVLAMEWSARRATSFDDDYWKALKDEACGNLGIRQSVRLKLRSAGEMPAVWGVLRPIVLLPRDCTSWSKARRRAVLVHELAHVARRDLFLVIAGHIACALHWFNPLAWALQRQLGIEREHACDDLALKQGMPSARYADHLLNTAAAYRMHRSLAPVMAARSQLEGRIMAILDTDRNRTRTSWSAQLLLAVVAIVALLPLSSLAWAQAASNELGTAERSGSDSVDFDRQLAKLGISMGDVDALIAGLGAPEAMTRGACAWALGAIADPRVIDPLIDASYDTDALVRQWSVRSLGKYSEPRIAPALIERLNDVDAETRQWAVRKLEGFDSELIVQPLIDTIDDDDAETRQWVVRKLGNIADPRVIGPLIDASYDVNAEVRQWAVRSLDSYSGPRIVPALIDRLNDADAETRQWAARKLGNFVDPSAQRALIEALAVETDSEATEWLVRSIDASADPGVLDALILALSHPSSDVRQWAVRRLGGSREGRAVNELISMLEDEDAEVREWAVRGLAVCGNSQAIGPIESMQSDPNEEVREWARRALEQIDC